MLLGAAAPTMTAGLDRLAPHIQALGLMLRRFFELNTSVHGPRYRLLLEDISTADLFA
jgi:hypothetical protein